jgi:hypothetical protein
LVHQFVLQYLNPFCQQPLTVQIRQFVWPYATQNAV